MTKSKNRKETQMAKDNRVMESLFLTGCCLKDKIRIWSAQKKLKPEDLGFGNEDVNDKLITLGSKFLIPKDEIRELEKIRSEAKQLIGSNSFHFDFGGNFVPNQKMESLTTKLNEMKERFDTKVADLGGKYPAMRDEMLNLWNQEAVAIAARQNDPALIDEVMNRVKAQFKDWDEIKHRFSFTWKEYRDINEIAREFIEDASRGVVEKLGEFAQRLKDRISKSNLQERNLKPIREFLTSLQDGLMVFENEQLTEMVNELDTWVQSGTAKDLKASKNLRGLMQNSMDKVISAAESQVDEIAKAAVDAITGHGRNIEI